mmetsp:Transcript_16505/g.24413  ORF Transcript_16505/g.24413 Transcript_16505/m.24413 type:complete len:219 (-) Transcript_16505:207-863(-)
MPTPAPVVPATEAPTPTTCEELGNCYYVCGEAPCKRPSQIIFEYTGLNCENPANNNTQEGKFECEDFADIEADTNPKTIEFADKNGMIGTATGVNVKDCVSVGYDGSASGGASVVDCDSFSEGPARRELRREEYLVDQQANAFRGRRLKNTGGSGGGGGGGDGDCVFRFEADTTILIKDGNDMVLQEQSIHTSCSKGLFVGDVYASLTVKYLLFDLAA